MHNMFARADRPYYLIPEGIANRTERSDDQQKQQFNRLDNNCDRRQHRYINLINQQRHSSTF